MPLTKATRPSIATTLRCSRRRRWRRSDRVRSFGGRSALRRRRRAAQHQPQTKPRPPKPSTYHTAQRRRGSRVQAHGDARAGGTVVRRCRFAEDLAPSARPIAASAPEVLSPFSSNATALPARNCTAHRSFRSAVSAAWSEMVKSPRRAVMHLAWRIDRSRARRCGRGGRRAACSVAARRSPASAAKASASPSRRPSRSSARLRQSLKSPAMISGAASAALPCVGERLHLAPPAARHQAQMHAHAMHRHVEPRAAVPRAVKQAAALEAMVGDVLVGSAEDEVATPGSRCRGGRGRRSRCRHRRSAARRPRRGTRAAAARASRVACRMAQGAGPGTSCRKTRSASRLRGRSRSSCTTMRRLNCEKPRGCCRRRYGRHERRRLRPG